MAENQYKTHDGAIGWAILGGVIFCIALLIWYFQGHNISSWIRWVRVAEMYVGGIFVDDDYMIRDEGGAIATFGQIRDEAEVLPAVKMKDGALYIISLAAMTPLKYLITFILLCLGFWSLMMGPKARYRSKLDLSHLIKRQSLNFKSLVPFVTFNPNDMPSRPPGAPVPAELPPFSEALGPEEWLAFYDVPVPDGKVDAEGAARAFSVQLGPPWRGPMHMEPYRQIFLAAFCLKAARKRSAADDMLGALAASWSHEQGLKIPASLLKEARGVLRNRDIAGKVLTKCNQHAYENTALMRALNTAREEGGVLAPATFVWLRGFDRALWYPLNNLGRQAYHMEALGAMCHYKAEKMAQRPIPRPKTEDAVKAISEYMTSTNARPIPVLDYSKSKKRAIKKVTGT